MVFYLFDVFHKSEWIIQPSVMLWVVDQKSQKSTKCSSAPFALVRARASRPQKPGIGIHAITSQEQKARAASLGMVDHTR
jgi:hypothetical protein